MPELVDPTDSSTTPKVPTDSAQADAAEPSRRGEGSTVDRDADNPSDGNGDGFTDDPHETIAAADAQELAEARARHTTHETAELAQRPGPRQRPEENLQEPHEWPEQRVEEKTDHTGETEDPPGQTPQVSATDERVPIGEEQSTQGSFAVDARTEEVGTIEADAPSGASIGPADTSAEGTSGEPALEEELEPASDSTTAPVEHSQLLLDVQQTPLEVAYGNERDHDFQETERGDARAHLQQLSDHMTFGGYPMDRIDYWHPQGWNRDFRPGTCGIVSVKGVARDFGLEVSEYELVNLAEEQGLIGVRGGTTPDRRLQLLSSLGIESSTMEGQTVGELARYVEDGRGVIAAVSSGELYDSPDLADYTRNKAGESVANHAVFVTGTMRGEDGFLVSFVINDSAGRPGETVSVAQMEQGWQYLGRSTDGTGGGALNVTVGRARDSR